MTTAAPNISARIHSLNRPNLVSIGTIIWLSSELMFFAGLFAIYFTARAQNPPTETWPPHPTELNVPYALVVTIILAVLLSGGWPAGIAIIAVWLVALFAMLST